MPRCVFPTSNAASARTATSSASARSQLADLHSGSITPSKVASKPAHRLQVQSIPSTAQASLHGQETLREAPSTLGAARPHAAGPDAVRADTAGPDAAGPDAAGPDADSVGDAPDEESCDAAEQHPAHTVTDVQSMGSCSTSKTADASRLAAARPRLQGLRLSWLTNQAWHSPEQVTYTCTTADVLHMGFSGNMSAIASDTSTVHQAWWCQTCWAESLSKSAVLIGAWPGPC